MIIHKSSQCVLAKVAQEAIEKALLHGDEVAFTFNEVEIIASPSSYVKDLCMIYDLKRKLARTTR